MQVHCKNRALREELYRAFVTRASSEDSDNTPVIEKILRLRKERAALLGYECHAEVSMASKVPPPFFLPWPPLYVSASGGSMIMCLQQQCECRRQGRDQPCATCPCLVCFLDSCRNGPHALSSAHQ